MIKNKTCTISSLERSLGPGGLPGKGDPCEKLSRLAIKGEEDEVEGAGMRIHAAGHSWPSLLKK